MAKTVLKVQADTDVKSLSSAIINSLKDCETVVRAAGKDAVNQMIKGVAIATKYFRKNDIELLSSINFVEVEGFNLIEISFSLNKI